jgi:5-methylcytosine-specific restriction endonuclease McrA
MRRHPGRGGAAWRRVRALVLKDATVCAICGGALRRDVHPRHPKAPSVDHMIPLKATRALDAQSQRSMALDPALLRAVHYGCNSARGARKPKRARATSREW